MLNIFNKNKHTDNAEFKKDLGAIIAFPKKSNDSEWKKNLQLIDEKYWDHAFSVEIETSSNIIPFILERN